MTYIFTNDLWSKNVYVSGYKWQEGFIYDQCVVIKRKKISKNNMNFIIK